MNRLHDQASLYLRQHRDNPVHWQPWDERALAEARERDCPILLSIGYSACHWCHVMAHESFEDEATAELMNRLFVNIKVDREEHPDLDRLYQLSHQLLTSSGGGWPLTVFLDPADHVAFFTGTYFPLEARPGIPAFRDVLGQVRAWFDDNRDNVAEQNQRMRKALVQIQGGSGTTEPAADTVDAFTTQALQRYDTAQGGFGGAPKFPQAPILRTVLDRVTAGEDRLVGPLTHTLARMAGGGLRDHLDGGFFRYCVDGAWVIPHFEKMLYDNAQLLPLYAEASARLDAPALGRVAAGIADWLEREMTVDGGLWAASIDADADGEEGGFHVWTPDQVRAVLDDDAWRAFAAVYGLTGSPNFEGKAWHLQVRGERPDETDPAVLQRAREQLRAAREERVHPTRDDKVLAGWNALTVSGLARAGAALGRDEWIDRAAAALDALHATFGVDGRLLSVAANGEARLPATLDDQAFMLEAVLAVLGQRFQRQRLEWAMALAEGLLRDFTDDDGGLVMTPPDRPVPVTRLRSPQDDAWPSGTGIAIGSLLALGHLLGEPRYLGAAERALGIVAADAGRYPLAYPSTVRAIGEWLEPGVHIVIAGSDRGAVTDWHRHLRGQPGVTCYAVDAPDPELPGVLGRYATEAPVTAWLCRGTRCDAPTGDFADLEEALAGAADDGRTFG